MNKNIYKVIIRNSIDDIFIINDEDIKNCWVLNIETNAIYLATHRYEIQPIIKKIILTTNSDLIKEGIQEIDNEFLEWFVKNPSCDEVEVEKICDNCGDINCVHAICSSQIAKNKGVTYKIIIPKEEELKFEKSIENSINFMSFSNSMFGKQEELKQETPAYQLISNYYGQSRAKRSKEHKENIGKVLKHPISQYDLQGNFIKNWDSIREAANELGFLESQIGRCVNGKRKTAYKFIWKRQ